MDSTLTKVNMNLLICVVDQSSTTLSGRQLRTGPAKEIDTLVNPLYTGELFHCYM